MSDNQKLTDVIMPQLAESLVSATIGKWLKKPGDPVEQYEPICELITDKVNAELPSTIDGVMGELLAEEGQVVNVGEVICRIAVPVTAPAAVNVTNTNTVAANNAAGQNANSTASDTMRARYSPAVQTLAAEHNIDLNLVSGTGMGGRITRKDVLTFIESGGATSPASISASQPAPAVSQPPAPQFVQAEKKKTEEPLRQSGLHLSESPRIPTIEVEGGRGSSSEYLIDVTPIRNTIATRMRQSVSEIPHAWTMIEVDVTNLVALRNKHKDEFKRKEGINLTYLAFMMKAVVSAIKDYPIMNSVWAVDKIIVKRDINISLAVGTEDSVITPVIKKADQKNIAGLAREIDELAQKTREGKLSLEDLQGGTFTVNNTGSFGSILSYPIINYPQAAILTFESIVKRPVVINDMIGVRSMANICLSLDHRILDGVICGRFLQRVKDNIEGYTPDTKLY
ncbi:2-oxoisovalerate dehydrogenase E2 component (dihydrolipoyl transacylase) [Paenibacillus sp. PastF-3]|uniref:dihydrolipoamide acetyltransferase family protein n=1 Tax=Paenibacillus sp. PastF-3 TaxID=2940626 RepID=UPI002474651D|nr:dihydrolipoamide acetyltransferase family protein [Paenibacillus sp. PastF-3]MDH6369743.1 2-oxoisovalerate dehydrogenase E2 component (dihydrolipoyl transacylase) [Paenibacillus sp. PastF-3]